MLRPDLLALNPDDLAALTNRGTVKRAQKELEAGDPRCDIHEADGQVTVVWSDGTTCRFPPGKTIHEAVCSSGFAGISRHIVRSVLAYQQKHSSDRDPVSNEASPAQASLSESTPESTAKSTAETAVVSPTLGAQSWDPGEISDDALVACFRKPAITQARKRFEQGVLVELTRGAKPVARFLDEGCTIRFLVPGDPRYVSADCAESLLSVWVPMAIWAFREFPADRLAGLLSLRQTFSAIPAAKFVPLRGLIDELFRDGLSGLAESWSQRMTRVEQSLRDEGLVWLAELTADLIHQEEMYRTHDARFEARLVPYLIGELSIRMRALVNDAPGIPQSLISGTKADRLAEIAGGRMIGVGLGVRPTPQHTTLSAYLQDVDSGSVLAVERTFPNSEGKGVPRRSFVELAQTAIVRGVSLANLATSQLLIKSGKRTPSGQLVLPRVAANIAVHPQSYQWEQLRPPLAAESFKQIAARLETLPSSSLRPRRRTENLHVVSVQSVEDVAFDVANQVLRARLRDPQGGVADLIHPFHACGQEGFSDFAAALENHGSQVRYVSGHLRAKGAQLEIQPIALIVDDGLRRQGIVPWLPNSAASRQEVEPHNRSTADNAIAPISPVGEFLSRLEGALADLLLTGLPQGDERTWHELSEVGQQIGFVRLTIPINTLAAVFQNRKNTLQRSASDGLADAEQLCLLSRLMADV